ncbi:MAG: glutathione S-transferase [Parvularcula sp.]|nr:glutathione S-transferase [Parvularcula sp.]
MNTTLYGSLTSPYARLCRVVRRRAGLEEQISFVTADPFDEAFRQHNPLGKVPALIVSGGPALFETTLIVRTLDGMGGGATLPPEGHARLQAEADIALMMGILDLGVAYRLEEMRPKEEQSPRWMERRLLGLRTALPLVQEAARRAGERPEGAAAAAFAVAGDWLRFRLAPTFPFEEDAPEAGAILDRLLEDEALTSTDPRRA